MTARDHILVRSCLGLLVLLGGSFVSVAQAPTLLEPDYTLTTLPSGIGSAGLACSPGGAWGDFVYVADSAAGWIERIDFNDNVSTFAGPFSFPVGLEFGPGPGDDFGTLLYVGDFASSRVSRVTTGGTISSFASFPGPGEMTFDPSGAYGTQLFVGSPVSSSIRTIDHGGSSDFFSSAPSDYLSFGPGGAWGDGLYSTDRSGSVSGSDCCFDNGSPGCSDADCRTSVCSVDPTCCIDTWDQSCANLALDDGVCACDGYGPGIIQVDPAGTPTSFVDGFVAAQGFDWVDGAGWNGDMFVADLADGVVRRLTPGGISTDFALVAGAANVTFCNCSLYVVSLNGGRWRISSDADDSDMDGTGAACDTCPGFFNPPGVTPVFGMDIVASSKTEFSWPIAVDVVYVRGQLALVSDYPVDFLERVAAGTSFSDATVPAFPGAGFYYLARPDCPGASWQTRLGAEPDRDAALP
jgi:hypothetical protein